MVNTWLGTSHGGQHLRKARALHDVIQSRLHGGQLLRTGVIQLFDLTISKNRPTTQFLQSTHEALISAQG
jgi:hypothetical protein